MLCPGASKSLCMKVILSRILDGHEDEYIRLHERVLWDTHLVGCIIDKSIPKTSASGQYLLWTILILANGVTSFSYSAISIPHIPVPVPISRIRSFWPLRIETGAECRSPFLATEKNLWQISIRSISCFEFVSLIWIIVVIDDTESEFYIPHRMETYTCPLKTHDIDVHFRNNLF